LFFVLKRTSNPLCSITAGKYGSQVRKKEHRMISNIKYYLRAAGVHGLVSAVLSVINIIYTDNKHGYHTLHFACGQY